MMKKTLGKCLALVLAFLTVFALAQPVQAAAVNTYLVKQYKYKEEDGSGDIVVKFAYKRKGKRATNPVWTLSATLPG